MREEAVTVAEVEHPRTGEIVRTPVTQREIDSFLDGMDTACSKGIHPLHAIQVRGGVTKCMACGRRVYA